MSSLFSNDTIFARFMNSLSGVLWVGILWLVCSLPLITLPAASMAAYHTMSRVVRRGKGYTTGVFFRHLGSSLKRWFSVSILDLIVLVWLLFDIIYLYGYGSEFSQTLSYIIYGIFFLYIAVNAVLFPCASRFSGGRFQIFKMAFYVCFAHLWASFLLTVLFGLGLYAVWLMPWSILLVPGVYWFAATLLLEPVLKKYSRSEEEDEEEQEDKAALREEVISDDGEVVESRLGNLVIRRRRGGKKEEPEPEKSETKQSFWDRIIRK